MSITKNSIYLLLPHISTIIFYFTTNTLQFFASCIMALLTLPNNIFFKPPSPLLPTTIMSNPSFLATLTIVSGADPSFNIERTFMFLSLNIFLYPDSIFLHSAFSSALIFFKAFYVFCIHAKISIGINFVN